MKIWCLKLRHRRNTRKYFSAWCDCPKFTAEHVIELRYVKKIKYRNIDLV